MRPLPLIRRLTAMFAVPLALWSALPTVRWCSVGWNEVRVACFVPCVVGAAADECAAETQASCGTAGASCGAASTSCGARSAGSSCEGTDAAGTEPDSKETSTTCPDGAEFPCGLAFCLDGPTGGDGIPADGRAPQLEPPSVSAAILPASPLLLEVPARWALALDGADDSPASPTRARFHQARAPPASV